MSINKTEEGTGPQGTQAFTVDEVNKMIAEEIINSQSNEASIPALIGLSSGLTGKRFIFDNKKFIIGRNSDNFIVLSEPSVSSMHAQIRKVEAGWKLMNLLSSNGTFVNGEKVTEKIIIPGDRIAFAEAEFIFGLVDEEAKEENKSRGNNLMFITAAAIVSLLFIATLIYYLQ